GGKLIFICLVNVSVAMCIGLTIMNTLRPGEQWRGHLDQMATLLHPKAMARQASSDPDAPKSATLNIKENVQYYVPNSLIRPLFSNNVISIVLMGLLGGAALRRVKEQQRQSGETSIRVVEQFVEAVYHVLIQTLEWVVQAIPFAVFGVVAQVVGGSG